MGEIVELYEDEMGNIALVHGDRAYTTKLGESFSEDAQNIVEGHFAHMLTESRHDLNLSRDHRIATYNGGSMAIFVEPTGSLKDYVGAHVDE